MKFNHLVSGVIVKQLKTTSGVLLFLFSNLALADSSYLGHAPDRGILISVVPNKPRAESGEKITFNGSIKIVGIENGGNKLKSLLEEFKKQGLVISASFPSAAVDISNVLVLRGISKDEIQFSYETNAINVNDLNQFSIQVFNKNLMAQNVFALQVDNLTATKSQISTVMSKFKFIVEASPGNAIDGMSTVFTSKVEYLNQAYSSEKPSAEDSGDGYYLAEFYFNNLKIDSKQSAGSGKYVNLFSEYQSPKLRAVGDNTFSVALYHYENGKAPKRMGYLNYQMPVQADAIKPIWLVDSTPNNSSGMIYAKQLDHVNLKASDLFGRIDPDTFTSHLSGSLVSGSSINRDVALNFQKTKVSDGASYTFSTDLNPLEEGLYTLTSDIKDLALNIAELNVINFRIDRTLPQIQLQLSNNILTNKTKINVPVLVDDLSPTTTSIYVNGLPVMYSLEKEFTAQVDLGNEGYNSIQIISVDAAGNSNISNEVFVSRDTMPPRLAMITPLENEYVNGVQFDISVSSNEEIIAATVNDKVLKILSDKTTLHQVYTSLSEGDLSLNVAATDKAGNTGYLTTNVKVLLKALNPSLVGLYPDQTTGKVFIKGAIAATRPFLEVKASSSFLNSKKVTASEKGEFLIELDIASKYKVEVYDPIINETLSADYELGAGPYILSGTVRDINDKPLVGASVSIQGTSVRVTTDANGVFEFLRSAYPNIVVSGDQMLVIDGSSVMIPDDGVKRKFSKTSIAISIGLKQSNVLQRPIYMAPVYLDDSATEIITANGGTVSDIHAPGVSLDIPAGAAVFPNGQTTEKISLIEIPSEVSTVEVPEFAVPDKVIALEPSGTTFKEPIKLTLPNVNEFPPHTDMVVMLMNSKTGRWELGGMATVSSDGQSVVTKEAQGIKHFSLAFATIPGPTKLPIGSQEKPGADTFNGAVTTQIKLPSTKIMGQDVAPGLVYKSTWAKPSLLVTNMFDFPMNSIKLEPQIIVDNNGVVTQGREKIRHCWKVDKITGWTECVDKEFDYYYHTAFVTVTSELEAIIKPKKVTSHLLTENLKSDDYVFEASPGNEFPRMSAISYKMDLKNSDGEYLETGVYPYYADFNIEFSGLIIKGNASTLATTKGTVDGRNIFNVTVQNKDFSITNEVIENMGVETQSLSNTYIVQNKINSEAGTGWKIGGVQKILNPSAQRVAIEEVDGSVSTYSVQNTIETLLDGDLEQVNFQDGAAINYYPHIVAKSKGKDELIKFDVSKKDSQGKPESQNFSKFSEYKSTLLGLDYINWRTTTRFGFIRRYSYCDFSYYDYSFATKPAQMLFDGNSIIGVDKVRHSIFSMPANSSESTIVGENTVAFSDAINVWEVFYQTTGNVTGYPGPTYYPTEVLTYCNSTEGVSCGQARDRYAVNVPVHYGCSIPANNGKRPFAGSSINGKMALNNPQAIAVKPNSQQVYVADTGNNRVLLVDHVAKTSSVFAGNQNTMDSGDGGLATSAGIKHPQGVAADQYGNVYISTESGYIKKVNSQQIISTIAGSVSGTVTESGDALTMKLINPKGLVVDDQKGILFIADYGGNRIFALHLESGQMQVVAGNGSNSGSLTSALDTPVVAPKLLALDQNLNLLFTSDATNRLQRLNFQNVANGAVAFASVKEDNSKLYKYANNMWARVYRDGTISRFDEQGRHLSDKDKIGNEVRYEYEGTSSRLTRINYPTGQKSEFIYSGELLNEIIDPAGRSTSFEYSDNKLTKVIYPDGNAKRYEYTEEGVLTKEFNENNVGLEYVYNNLDRISKYIMPNGAEVSIEDQAFVSLKDPNQPKSLKDLTSTITDPSSNTTSIEKDYRGYVFAIMDSEGKTTKTIRDEKGRVVKVERPDGTSAEFVYDSMYGDLVKSIDTATGNSVEVRYDQSGHEIYKKDSRGNVTQNIYNTATGLLDRTVLPDTSEILFQYDSRGLLIKKSVALQNGTLAEENYVRDVKGNVTKRTVSGKSNSFELDASGNVVKSISEKEAGVFVTTQFEYNLMNRLMSVTSPNLEKTSYTYSNTGQLSEIIDPKENSTVFRYNEMNQLVEKIDPEGFLTKMTYDVLGNVETQTDPNGNLKTYTYSKSNQIKTIQLSDDLITYEYNINQKVSRITNVRSDVHYERDEQGRLIYESMIGTGDLTGYPLVEHNYKFDANGNVTEVTQKLNSQLVDSKLMSYDNLSRLRSVNSSTFGGVAFSYDNLSRLTGVDLGNISYTNNFNEHQELSGIKYLKNADSSTLQEFGFSYDQRSFITQKRMLSSVAAETPEARSLKQIQLGYNYGQNGQLTEASSLEDTSLNENFSYDPLGNRLTDKYGNYIYDTKKQRLQEDGQYLYLYDNNGNILYKNSKDSAKLSYQYEYSSTNQLKLVRVLQKTVSLPLGEVIKEVSYKYDVLGRRLRKDVVDHQSTADITKNYKINYIYQGDNIAVELDANDNVLLAQHFHSPLKADDILKSSYTDRAKELGFVKNVGVITYIKDQLGTVTELADNSGNIKQRYSYRSYGVLRSISSSDGSQDITLNPEVKPYFTFSGREWDSETELYYYRARYYDANTGRFLQKDPDPGKLAVPSTFLSKYIYGVNSPVMFSDPSGMSVYNNPIEALLQAGHDLIAAFGAGFDNFIKDKMVQTILVLAAAAFGAFIFAPIIAGAFGFTSGSGAMVASTLWGAVVGGVIGGIGYEASGIGSFKEGFRAGAIVGSIAGGLNYGYHATAKFSTTSADLAERLVGYLVMGAGIIEPLHFIPTAWSCDDLSVEVSTSGLIGACNDK